MEEQARKSWETWHLVVAVVFALLIGVVIGAAVNNDDDGPGDAAEAVMNTAPASFPPTSAPPATGTRSAPIPLARSAALDDDWTIKVVDVRPDAWSVIAAEAAGNVPPASGHQYYMVHVAMTYTGSQATSPRSDVRFSTVGESNVAYGDDANCGVVPNALSSIDVPRGGTITGNLCWSVTSGDADALLLVAAGASGRAEPLFFALD
jgi:hypothetical protein